MQKKILCSAAAICLLAAQANMAGAQEGEIATYRIAAIKWEYAPMAKAAAFYNENRARYAPNSSLRFRLPVQVKGLPDKPVLKLLGPDYADEIALDEAKSFALPSLSRGAADDTSIVSDGYFKKGAFALPVPVVRTSTLAPNIVRFGDVRLTCRTTIKYVRAYKMAFNLLIGSLKAFSLDVCGGDEREFPTKVPMDFNKVTWLVGDKVVKVETLPTVQREFKVPIGDEAIADDTLLAFELVPAAVADDQASKGGQ
jgi:hypothetical protein